MSKRGEANRREFLTGRAAQKALEARGEEIADALLEATNLRPIPEGGETIRVETRAMGCQWSVILNPGPPRQMMVASDALDLVHGVEDLLTVYRDDSEVARLNACITDGPQPVSEELFQYLERCRELWEETEGAFDPASGALIRLWRDCRAAGRVPSEDEVAMTLQQSGMRHLHFDAENGTVWSEGQGISLDFGGIGKGTAIDLAAGHLDHEEIGDYLIHGGQSSLFARGTHAGHAGWPIGIRNPLIPSERYGTILLQDAGMSTSGSNVQYFRHEGRRYGHLLDPRTGWPAEGLLSVTVIAPTAERADALSTAFYAMGLDNSLRYCDDHLDVGAILIPPPARGRTLQPVVRNVPEDRWFLETRSDDSGA